MGAGVPRTLYFHLSGFHQSTTGVTYKPSTNKQRRSLAGEGEEEAGEGDVRSFPSQKVPRLARNAAQELPSDSSGAYSTPITPAARCGGVTPAAATWAAGRGDGGDGARSAPGSGSRTRGAQSPRPCEDRFISDPQPSTVAS